MKQVRKLSSTFSCSGKLAKIYRKKNKVKSIKLITSHGKYRLKIAKKLRQEVATLSPGCQLEIAGKSKRSKKNGKIKLTARRIAIIPHATIESEPVKTKVVSLFPESDTEIKSQAKVLICQKSNCWKKGGKQIHAKLESVLGDRNIQDKIQIKKTGCLKKCKNAPNLVMLPDKSHYTKVKPQQVEKFVEKHLIADS